MKRNIAKILGTTLMLAMAATTSMAMVPRSELSLGGISIFSTVDYMKSIYGQPDSVRDNGSTKMPVYTYAYGKSVTITSCGGRYTHVISVSANNGWATPAGVTVGMDISVLNRVYGNADRVWTKGSYKFYEYKATRDGLLYLTFKTKKGIIKGITTGSQW